MHDSDEHRPDRLRTKPSTVYRNVEILYHPDSREWSFVHPDRGGRVFLRAQGSARAAIDRILGHGMAEGPSASTGVARRPSAGSSSRSPVPAPMALDRGNAGSDSLADTLGGVAAGSAMARLPASGRAVPIPVLARVMDRWNGALPANFRVVPNKTAVNSRGKATYPELAVVDHLRDSGWDARWRMNFAGSGWWTSIGVAEALPPFVSDHVRRITDAAAEAAARLAVPYRRGGIWDVVAWRGDTILFVELKGSEPLNTNQLMWLEAALEIGIPRSAFAVVRYQLR